MDDLLILLALLVWFGLWAARDHGRCGITRWQGGAEARRVLRSRAVPDDRTDGPYADAAGQRP